MPVRLLHFPLLTPTETWVSYHDGYVDLRIERESAPAPHNAIDIHSPSQTPIVSTTNGIVVEFWHGTQNPREVRPGVGLEDSDCNRMTNQGGNSVLIYEEGASLRESYLHYYAHLYNTPLVNAGDSVYPGKRIGFLGDTGRAAGGSPHLHYQVYTVREATGTGAHITVRARGFENPFEELCRLRLSSHRIHGARRPRG